ncbi:hypothetical protein DV737_g1476, partial [Chaetothyriales sp. CBS 132003]
MPSSSPASRSNRDPNFPLFQLTILAFCRLGEPIAFTSVLAYIYVFTKDIRHSSENAAFYAGLLVSAFAVAEVLTAYHWGLLSDRIGRKPVVLFALAGTAASNLMFGFATNYWVALASRFLGGLLNGNVAVMQTMVAEMCKKPEHEPKAYAMIPFVCAATPDDKPSITIMGIESTEEEQPGDEESSYRYSWEMILLIVQLILMSYHSMVYASLLPTFLVDEPLSKGLDLYGGLGYTVRDVGGYLAIQAVIAMFVQVLIFPLFVEKVGIWKSFFWLTILCPIAYVVVPFLTILEEDALPWGIYADMLLQNFFLIIIYPCAFYGAGGSAVGWWSVTALAMAAAVLLYFMQPPRDSTQPPSSEACIFDRFCDAIKSEFSYPVVCCDHATPIQPSPAIEIIIGRYMKSLLLAKKTEYETIDRTYCHVPTCSTFIAPSTIKEELAVCPKCQTTTCAKCKRQWHGKDGTGCKDSGDKMFKAWCAEANLKKSDEAVQSRFPKSPSQFDADPRISFSRLDNKFLLETEEGTEYEWDTSLKRWIPVLDQELLDQQAAIYKVEGVDDDAATTVPNKKKRKQNGDEGNQKQKKPRANTAVYVTSIPLDATRSEIQSVFSKCGMIAEEIDSGQPRIKMYEDEQGAFKGDALVVYFRPESVQLALQMLDDSDFRLAESRPSARMRVQAADFSYKSQQDVPEKKSKGEQRKIIKKTQKMNSKLADWDDDDAQLVEQPNSRWDKVVILKHMFTLQELEEDPGAILEIKEDIRDECSKLGEVTNVVLFDKEADGVASVRFTSPEAAEACVMNGRWFDERQLEAFVATGNENFRKTNEKSEAFEDEDSDGEKGRLDKFGSWLEEGKKS